MSALGDKKSNSLPTATTAATAATPRVRTLEHHTRLIYSTRVGVENPATPDYYMLHIHGLHEHHTIYVCDAPSEGDYEITPVTLCDEREATVYLVPMDEAGIVSCAYTYPGGRIEMRTTMGESDAKMMRMGSGSKAVRFVGARIVSNDPRGCYAREGSQIKFIPDDRSEGRSFDVRGKLNNSVAGFHWITRWGNFTYAHNELGTLTLETGEWRDNLLPELQKTEMFIAEFAGDEILLQTHFRRTDGSEVLRVMSPGDDGLLRTAFETKVASGAHIIGACLIPKNKTKGKAEVVAECVSFFPKELGKMIWQYAY